MRRHISVLGLGYVGLPVATSFGRAGFEVVGFDIDARRISELANGYDTPDLEPLNRASATIGGDLKPGDILKNVSAETPETQEIVDATCRGVVQAATHRAPSAVLDRAGILAGVAMWRL